MGTSIEKQVSRDLIERDIEARQLKTSNGYTDFEKKMVKKILDYITEGDGEITESEFEGTYLFDLGDNVDGYTNSPCSNAHAVLGNPPPYYADWEDEERHKQYQSYVRQFQLWQNVGYQIQTRFGYDRKDPSQWILIGEEIVSPHPLTSGSGQKKTPPPKEFDEANNMSDGYLKKADPFGNSLTDADMNNVGREVMMVDATNFVYASELISQLFDESPAEGNLEE